MMSSTYAIVLQNYIFYQLNHYVIPGFLKQICAVGNNKAGSRIINPENLLMSHNGGSNPGPFRYE